MGWLVNSNRAAWLVNITPEAFCYASWRFKSYYANGGFPRLNYVAM